MSTCPGSCNTQWRIAEKQRKEHGTPHEFIPKQGEPVWCSSCARSIEFALKRLPQDAALVRVEMYNGTPNRAERVSGSRERPLHQREGLADIINTIAEVLTCWESDVRERRNFTPPLGSRQGKRIEVASAFLVKQLPWILHKHPYEEATREFGREVLAVHRKAQQATHNTPPKQLRCVGVRCPKCAWKALVREMDEQHRLTGYVFCEHCKNLFTESEYQRHVKKEAHGRTVRGDDTGRGHRGDRQIKKNSDALDQSGKTESV